jgi:hypothetical protein
MATEGASSAGAGRAVPATVASNRKEKYVFGRIVHLRENETTCSNAWPYALFVIEVAFVGCIRILRQG